MLLLLRIRLQSRDADRGLEEDADFGDQVVILEREAGCGDLHAFVED